MLAIIIEMEVSFKRYYKSKVMCRPHDWTTVSIMKLEEMISPFTYYKEKLFCKFLFDMVNVDTFVNVRY